MKRVLVTGATGFIGRQSLAALRARNVEVYAVSSRTPPSGDGVRWLKVDLLAPGAAGETVRAVSPTHLLHLAWYAVPGRFWTAPENLPWVQASVDLLRALADAGGRFVGAGTCAEYAPADGDCDERRTPVRPATLYGACKHAVGTIADAVNGARVSAAWGRVFHLYGPGEAEGRLVPAVVRALLARQPAECTAGTQLRDFMHVQDVGEAFVALLESDVRGPVNIASGEPVTVADLVVRLARGLDAEPLLRLGARPTPAGEPPRLTADVRRLRQEVGFHPSHTLDAGLAETLRWWREARLQ